MKNENRDVNLLEPWKAKAILATLVKGIRDLDKAGGYSDSEILEDVRLSLKAGGINV